LDHLWNQIPDIGTNSRGPHHSNVNGDGFDLELPF